MYSDSMDCLYVRTDTGQKESVKQRHSFTHEQRRLQFNCLKSLEGSSATVCIVGSH